MDRGGSGEVGTTQQRDACHGCLLPIRLEGPLLEIAFSFRPSIATLKGYPTDDALVGCYVLGKTLGRSADLKPLCAVSEAGPPAPLPGVHESEDALKHSLLIQHDVSCRTPREGGAGKRRIEKIMSFNQSVRSSREMARQRPRGRPCEITPV
ncbi:hypothetical protein EVAR_100073_1 [Eumeta japonica]|uniref:Uncharacterized protein n=1 Tax=Eumeta variegata TaxID=151549 RepID=A0A4C1YV69_EUMVA|nr:hypothetical protein EVAR_100073_1 [Eumeta japonica]